MTRVPDFVGDTSIGKEVDVSPLVPRCPEATTFGNRFRSVRPGVAKVWPAECRTRLPEECMWKTFLWPVGGGVRSEAVAQRIAEAVTLGLLREGEQLPSEVDLAAQLGVSTVTLREGLSQLRQRGLIETRRGRHGGNFVCGRGTLDQTSLQSRLRTTSAAELRDMGDEHMAIACACARLAAERASSSDIERLRRYAAAVPSARGVAQRAQTDSRFHIEIAVISQSERLTKREVSAQAEISELLWLPKPEPNSVDAASQAHEAIVEAIADEDAERAGRLAAEHVRTNIQRLLSLRLKLTES